MLARVIGNSAYSPGLGIPQVILLSEVRVLPGARHHFYGTIRLIP